MHSQRVASRAMVAAAAVLLISPSAPASAQHVSETVLGIPMDRMGSGTTWIPDAVSLPSRHWIARDWTVMLHGFVYGQVDRQSGSRGATQWGGLNWGMVMAERDVGGGRLQFRFMPSLDRLTVGKCGYPLLGQSGETCNGTPLVDRQHPHDLFMELAAMYQRAVNSKVAVMVYAAPAGEPALGPVAFMHRPSAMDEPMAPLGHHWQDATHISFGVVSAGVFTRTMRLEASAFNGREPDENRWDLPVRSLDSYSARLTLNPTANWSFTAGYGRLDNPESATPPEATRRLVASAMYGARIGHDGQWTSALIAGQNTEAKKSSASVLLESEAVLRERDTFFGRVELVRKTAGDLQVASAPADASFDVFAASLGYVREFARGRGVTMGLGARATVSRVPSDLESSYGSNTPVGGMVFLRLRPMRTNQHEGMEGMKMDGMSPILYNGGHQ